jgi:hypothetical protein
VSNPTHHALIISHDGSSWQALDMDGRQISLTVAEDSLLPELPDGCSAGRLLLPVEQLLARSFSLSLAHPRFIDADILAQELNERTGEKQEDWWLAWQATKDADGVAGLVFGLPEQLRQQINDEPQWQQLRSVNVDAWDRLQAQLTSYTESADLSNGPVAVFDADADGLFFGVWDRAGERTDDGVWRGMRRLNWDKEMLSEDQFAELATNIKRSLHAMGWQESAVATGRLGKGLLHDLEMKQWHGCSPDDAADEADMSGRQDENLALPIHTSLEFRHGQWAAQSGLGWVRSWRRSMALAAVILLVWVLGSAWQVQIMDAQVEQYKERISAAFHKGLPDETVIIDALAQLRRAAGPDTGETTQWFGQMNAIGHVYKMTPWILQELSFRDGVMKISGKANNLETLNSIHELLQRETGRDVQLTDTDLSGQQVAFRMHWR